MQNSDEGEGKSPQFKCQRSLSANRPHAPAEMDPTKEVSDQHASPMRAGVHRTPEIPWLRDELLLRHAGCPSFYARLVPCAAPSKNQQAARRHPNRRENSYLDRQSWLFCLKRPHLVYFGLSEYPVTPDALQAGSVIWMPREFCGRCLRGARDFRHRLRVLRDQNFLPSSQPSLEFRKVMAQVAQSRGLRGITLL